MAAGAAYLRAFYMCESSEESSTRESSASTLGAGSGLTTRLAGSCRSRYGPRTLGAVCTQRASAAGVFVAETPPEKAPPAGPPPEVGKHPGDGGVGDTPESRKK